MNYRKTGMYIARYSKIWYLIQEISEMVVFSKITKSETCSPYINAGIDIIYLRGIFVKGVYRIRKGG